VAEDIINIIDKPSWMGKGEVCTGFWWENLRERDDCGDQGVDGKIILRRMFKKLDVGVWSGLNWLRIETGGGHF
jgi:hypothetical protein